jgi:hypothetical protein
MAGQLAGQGPGGSRRIRLTRCFDAASRFPVRR